MQLVMQMLKSCVSATSIISPSQVAYVWTGKYTKHIPIRFHSIRGCTWCFTIWFTPTTSIHSHVSRSNNWSSVFHQSHFFHRRYVISWLRTYQFHLWYTYSANIYKVQIQNLYSTTHNQDYCYLAVAVESLVQSNHMPPRILNKKWLRLV